MGWSPSLFLYLAASRRAASKAAQKLEDGLKNGTEENGRTDERLGIHSAARPSGPLLWFHTTSEGEALSVQELIRRMAEDRDELSFLITTTTPAAAAIVARRMPLRTQHQYVPYDVVPFIERFLDHWRPTVAIWTDAEFRPALVTLTADRGIPVFLIDARLATKTYQRWRWVPGLAGTLLRRFEKVLVADSQTATYLRRLGLPKANIEVTGVLEEGTAALACNEAERDALARVLAARPVWLSAFTDPSEESLVSEAHRIAIRMSHRLLLVLVPSNPDEGEAIAARLEAEGWTVALRSRNEEPEEDTHIYVADTRGEMGLWYRLAPITFMGTSIASGGGRNPFEPAALGSAILHGPNVSSFTDSYSRLGKEDATRLVRTAEELAHQIGELLSPDKAAAMAHNAWMVSSSGAEVTDRVMQLLFDALDSRTAS
ncbi:3-deoxy-D-manno-octulosonic acid transferase [Pseudogemmobacter sp. W21_MBD1_M6]|uniref:3-deoxy-D-manno-octulosonic acid transferase n=1 Tax=Pseudogemmobacter sp. W21_MBD1_M6 TaxID=3240271 RepID=UPI003F951F7E